MSRRSRKIVHAAARNHDLEAIRLAALTALANYASVLDWSTEPAWEASRADLNRLLVDAVQEARAALDGTA